MNILLLWISFQPWAQADPLSAVYLNNRGVSLLEQERAFEAQQKFTEGLGQAPFQDEIHLNLGLSFVLQKEFEKALGAFKTVARQTQKKETKFIALFNAARILGELKRIPEALEFYQKALELEPGSEQVKTNIELLMSQSGGGGGGQGENKDKKSGEGKGQGEGEGDDPKDDAPRENKGQPKPYENKDLNESDVRKILEELKNQEQKIRRKEYDKKRKETPGGKDW